MDLHALFGLHGRIALVTGAAQGLGSVMAGALAEAGADVVLLDINGEGARRRASEIEKISGRRCLAVTCDISDADQVSSAMGEVDAAFGGLDVLINNAAVVQGRTIQMIDEKDWGAMLSVNLHGPFLCIQKALPLFEKKGGGSVINVSSMAAHIGVRPITQAHYQASKGGLDAMTRALAAELAPLNIRVNVLMPGNMKSPVLGPHMDAMDFWMMRTPMKRLGDMDEIIGPAIFLASGASSYVTGATLVADGGFLIW